MELELRTVMSLHVCVGNQTYVFCKIHRCFLFQSHISGHHLLIVVFNYMYTCVFECRFVHMTTVPMESQERVLGPWTWSYS